jgi:hypothetical protein
MHPEIGAGRDRSPNVRTPASGSVAAFALALMLGLAGVLFTAFFAQWYEYVVRRGFSWPQITPLVLAPVALFMFFVLLALVNPLLLRHAPSLALHRRELVLVLCVWLVGSAVCTEGFAPNAIHRAGQLYTGSHMNRPNVLALQNKSLFLNPDGAKLYARGLDITSTPFSIRRIPWREWAVPLAFWIPFLIVAGVLAMALVRMVHHQWSQHELLTYPLAEAADNILERAPNSLFPRVFSDRLFRIGFLITFLLYVINGMHLWFPTVVEVPLDFRHGELLSEFPFLARYCGGYAGTLFSSKIYPFMICIAGLIGVEVALTCWLGYILMILGCGLLFLTTGTQIAAEEDRSIQAGMYVALTAIMLYYGRREYASILRHALLFRRTDDRPLRAAAWACRVFLAAFASLVAILAIAGLDWLVSVALVTAFSIVLIVSARAVAEIGLPWLRNFSNMATLMPLKLLGAAAIAPKGLAVMAVIGSSLDVDLSNNLAAQQTVCSKLGERTPRLRSSALTVVLVLTLCVAIVGATFFSLRNNYYYGGQRERLPRVRMRGNLEPAEYDIKVLQLMGDEGAKAASGFTKLAHIQPSGKFLKYFALGGALVVICAVLRLRVSWWPLHPLPLIFVNTETMARFYVSIFLGWTIKMAILKIGGGRVCERSRPFFIGGLFGCVMGAGLWIGVAAIEYAITGIIPPNIEFFT